VSTTRKTTARLIAGLAGAALAATTLCIAPAHASSTVGGTITRSEVLQRAQSWVNAHVPYSEHVCYPSGASADPYATCSVPDYREDCSGFVSMAWHLTASLNTSSLPSVSTQLGSLSQLKPGDILDDIIDGHTILFAGWTNQANGDFIYYSESSPGTVTGQHSDNINNSQIAGLPGGNYHAYQYNKILDDTAAAPARIGVVDTASSVAIKEGGLGAGWVTETSGAAQVALSGTRIGVRYSDGTVAVKDGDLGAGWVTETSGAAEVALSGTRIGVRYSDGTVAVKDGGLGAPWVTETSGVTQLVLSGTRIGVLTTDGHVLVKDGDLGAAWVTVASGATQVALSGTRIGVRYADGTVAVKDGAVGAPWVTETSGAAAVALSDTRVGVLYADGTVVVKDGDLGAAWVTQTSGASQLVLSGTRIGVRYSDGTVVVKDGDLGAGWVTETSGAAQLALSTT
jgi:hypothetical protein